MNSSTRRTDVSDAFLKSLEDEASLWRPVPKLNRIWLLTKRGLETRTSDGTFLGVICKYTNQDPETLKAAEDRIKQEIKLLDKRNAKDKLAEIMKGVGKKKAAEAAAAIIPKVKKKLKAHKKNPKLPRPR
jgi:hypothetical protein